MFVFDADAPGLSTLLEWSIDNGITYLPWEAVCDAAPGVPIDRLKEAIDAYFSDKPVDPLYVGDGVFLPAL